ncbi:MAG: sigma-70 family RNA polymerase sigma factor [Planctomycetales bacterium]|nr:sigma-70 family RNA polymerase sigma factor [Planctomycetales bacterium]
MPSANQSPTKQELAPEHWVDEYGDAFFRYAISRLRDPNAAEEAVQETFLAGIRGYKQYAGNGAQRSWLMSILRNKVVDIIRARSRFPSVIDADQDPATLLFDTNGQWKAGVMPDIPPEAAVEAGELWEIVRHCLKFLPQRQADVFSLRVLEGRTRDEVCRDLSISMANYSVRLYRARLNLARCVGSKWLSEN